MTQKEILENQIKELKAKCDYIREGLFRTAEGKKKKCFNANEWFDIHQNRTRYLIHKIELISVEPKREDKKPCLRFIIEFEDGSSDFTDVDLPENEEV